MYHTEQPAAATDLHSLELPDEPCFTLQQLQLDGAHLGQFAFLQRYLGRYRGRCVGQQGIALIVRRASDLALAKGYVTTRIGLPEQSLGSGTLPASWCRA
jgi:hemolysin activation/secretion protein